MPVEKEDAVGAFRVDGDLLRVEIEGVEVAEDCVSMPCAHAELWISKAYEPVEALAETINRLLRQTPAPLRDAAERIVIFSAPPPLREDGIRSGAACHQDGVIFFWKGDDGPLLRQRVIQHELAHAASGDDGLPEGLRKSWDEAREIDRRHGSEITQFLSKTDRGSFHVHGTNVQFLLGNPWITEYVSRHEHDSSDAHDLVSEDWACSVESYLWLPMTRAGGLEFGDEVLRFEDLYPGRATLITDYLNE